MDGRQVEDVEAHGGDLGELLLNVFEGAVAAGDGRGGPRKELVPGGVAGALAIDPEGELGLVPRGEGEIGIAGDELLDFWSDGRLVDGGVLVGHPAQRGGDFFELGGVGTAGAGDGVVEEEGAGAQGKGNILRRKVGVGVGRLGVETLVEVADPGFEVIDPPLDRELPRSKSRDVEGARPEVVAERGHGGGTPAALGFMAIEEPRGKKVVAIAEDGGGDGDAVVEDAARGIAASIDLRGDLFDDDAATTFGRLHPFQLSRSKFMRQI
jgi:hypothetical protein